MAPPCNRRRFFESSSSASEMALFEPIPTLTHSVSDIEYKPDLLYGARTVPVRIEEIHLHIQERSIAFEHDEGAVLERRQSAYTVTTVDAAGKTITSVVTAGLHAGAPTSTFASSTSTTTSKNGAKTSSTSSTGKNTASSGKISVAAASSNSTLAGTSLRNNLVAQANSISQANPQLRAKIRALTQQLCHLPT